MEHLSSQSEVDFLILWMLSGVSCSPEHKICCIHLIWRISNPKGLTDQSNPTNKNESTHKMGETVD